jgi:8-oxo-dGTP diphosphatase
MDEGVILVKRGQEPFIGTWALPSGYIEEDESVEQAAVRECKEETGLDVDLVELFGVYSFPEGPVQSGIVVFYRAKPIGGVLRAGDDAQEVRVCAPDALPDDIAFRTHREVLGRWAQHDIPGDHHMLEEPLIRKATVDDIARVLDLLELIPANSGMTPRDRDEASLRLRESSSIEVLVAQVNGEVSGFVALSFIRVLTGLRVLIDDMAVDSIYQRHGIGAALLEAAMQEVDRRGASHLIVNTSRGDSAARAFYRACGFEDDVITPLRIR